jgi:hypothetical protein
MTPTIPDWLRPILARLVASIVAAGLSYAAHKGLDIGLTDTDRAHLTDAMLAIVLAIYGVAYAAVHKAISAKTNPTDAASKVLSAVATGPLGEGQRTQLAQSLEHAATSPIPRFVAPRPELTDDDRGVV